MRDAERCLPYHVNRTSKRLITSIIAIAAPSKTTVIESIGHWLATCQTPRIAPPEQQRAGEGAVIAGVAAGYATNP